MNQDLYAKCACQHCGTHIEFPIGLADHGIACPHCSQTTTLTQTAPEPTVDPDKISASEILNAFQGAIKPARISFFYRIGLVLVTLMMVLLPLVYLAMIGAAGWGVYYYASHFTFMLKSTDGGGRVYAVKLLAYITPLFVGGILVLFMIKPLFARRAPRAQSLALNPAVESTLFTFIAKICETVGAPMPKRIDLDCNLNASAGYHRGALGMLGNDLVLTIGMPLVAGLNLRQFAGVMAHEFGHFTQGFGMRLSYVIDSVNGWFARVVYERDAWDVALAQWLEEAEDWRVMIIVGCARLGVGVSRMLLMLLMFIGSGVSSFLSRQMEYDADSYEIKLAGSDATEQTIKRLAVLGKATKKTYQGLRAALNNKLKLPDNFPIYLMQQEAAMTSEQRQSIEDTVGLSRSGIFSTHPSDGDRIRCARKAGEPGVFHLELPATALFANFEVVAKQVTLLHYTDDIGLDCDPAMLRPVDNSATPQAQSA